ncbi:hypothetical protein [Pseudoxanthomonas indica]|uniref:Uncharacterized protein n=1 Tax=Pseudoxanthomonas indica TaxID=428993 RepID=A0A1T5LUG6_9GAMM|nr:hypothetical protein [Pseudoxanthomonas indica]GGD39309.1 hypothetical protein GCM10007235_09230 [Pseudoxanthomonas indica]SKC79208.1 hypothetical protein SAMN06296058_3050 [Pseudoxanthomonas indica]
MARTRKASRALTRQITDLAFIAPRVITRRVAQVAASGGQLSARDQRELSRMSSEKVMAAWESWAAMASYSFSLGTDIALAASTMWLPGISSKRLPSPEDAVARLASAGVRPYRRIAAANDRRLGKAKR